jgi:hypothetical protein
MKNGEKSTVMRKEVLEERQDGEGTTLLRFKTCGCLIDRDFQGAMNIMARTGEEGGFCSPTPIDA